MTSLLPPNATPLERALEAISKTRIEAVPAPIVEAGRPETAPATFLPFLAWGRSLDIWDRTWPEAVKRAAIADAPRLHRLKGTLAGVRGHLALAGAAVIEATVPPQGFFVSGGVAGDRDWEAWRAGLPEIRVERVTRASLAVGLVSHDGAAGEAIAIDGFLGSEADDGPTFFLGAPATVERAVVVRAGVETEALLERRPDPRFGRSGEVMEIAWPAAAAAEIFVDDALSCDGLLDGAGGRITAAAVALFPGARAASWNMIVPSPLIQDVLPETGARHDEDGVAFHADRDFADDGVVDDADPLLATFRSFRLMETVRAFGAPASFLDEDRLGIPAYTAELTTAVAAVAGPAVAFVDNGFFDDGHGADLGVDDQLAFACEAVVAAKSLRDAVRLDLDIPTPRSLRHVRSFAALQLR